MTPGRTVHLSSNCGAAIRGCTRVQDWIVVEASTLPAAPTIGQPHPNQFQLHVQDA